MYLTSVFKFSIHNLQHNILQAILHWIVYVVEYLIIVPNHPIHEGIASSVMKHEVVYYDDYNTCML